MSRVDICYLFRGVEAGRWRVASGRRRDGGAHAADNGLLYVPKVVEESQQAAEALAKTVIAGFGLSPATVHDLDALATQLENAYRGHARGAEERKRFAAAIRELDAITRAAHLARCHAPPVELPERTATRIGCAMRRDQAAVGGIRTNLAVIGLRIGSVRAILFHSCGTPVAGSTRSARGPRVRIAMKRNR